jgi:hypothetical protein
MRVDLRARKLVLELTLEPIAMQRRPTALTRVLRSPVAALSAIPGAALCSILFAALCDWPLPAAALLDQSASASATSSQTNAATHKPLHAHKRPAKPSPAIPAPQVTAAPVQPAAPPPPNWPVNDKPADATVVWDSHGLRVDAANSRLDQIFKEISTDTGVKVEGLGPSDVRIFGTYGPGPANEVISQLLNGTGYNVLMIGDQGAGAPRQLVLSKAPTGPATQSSAHGGSGDDDYEADQPAPPPPMDNQPNNGFAPPQIRTPQQIQEMQLRQEQIQQQLRQQMINQQQQQQPLPADTIAPPQ